MWGDYGYIEDETGRSYDLHLIWRFVKYARPYLPVLAFTCLLILAATASELLLPYMTKIAIDRYILVSARKVVTPTDTAPETDAILKQYSTRFTSSGKPGTSFLPGDNTDRIDPRDMRKLEKAGVIETRRYYIVPLKNGAAPENVQRVIDAHPALFEVYPRVAAIASDDLSKLPRRGLAVLRAGDIHGLGLIAVISVVVLVLGYFCDFIHVILIEYAGQKICHDLRMHLLRHVLNQSIAFHDSMPTGRLVARLTNDIQNLGEMIKSVAATFFKDAVILGGIVGLLLYLNVKLALATFTLIPVIIIITKVFGKKAREAFRELRAKVALINTAFGETIAGIRIVQVFLREERNRAGFARLNHENYLAGMKQITVFAIFMPLIEIMASATLAIIIWYGGLNVLQDTMTLGVVAAFIGYSRKFFQPIRELAEKFNIFQSAMASLERIFVLLDKRESLPEKDGQPPSHTVRGAIAFENVNFGYYRDEPVLKEVSFRIEPGETVAIVGATGSGKTSIINLLLRFYDPWSGSVRVDGQDIGDLPLPVHRSRIGLVMQDVFLFNGTVRENIALSRSAVSPEKVEKAAEAVGASGFIRSLPNGFDQKLGEGGRSLSLGQRQLLAFARVLVQDPDILVLDEATAFIDSESEKLIEHALKKLTEGRTSIIIAHRLSTIQRADTIVVLHKGRIVEAGRHEELLAAKGLYYRLYRLQSSENLVVDPLE